MDVKAESIRRTIQTTVVGYSAQRPTSSQLDHHPRDHAAIKTSCQHPVRRTKNPEVTGPDALLIPLESPTNIDFQWPRLNPPL